MKMDILRTAIWAFHLIDCLPLLRLFKVLSDSVGKIFRYHCNEIKKENTMGIGYKCILNCMIVGYLLYSTMKVNFGVACKKSPNTK